MRFHSRAFALTALVVGSTITTSLHAQAGQRPPREMAPRPGAQQPGVRREVVEERIVRGRGPERGPEGPGGGQFRPGRGNPAGMLLGLRTQLGLSEDQVKRLEALRDAAPPKPNTAEMLRARADLLEATQGDGNLAAARTALDKMSRLRTEQMLVGLKARQDARAILTPAQKTKVDGMRRQMASRARKAIRNRAMGGRGPGRGGNFGGARGGVRGGARGGERIIEERIIRGPEGGPQGPMMLRGGGRPPVPPQAPVAPDSVR